MKEGFVYGVAVLLFDATLSLAFLTGLVLLQLSGPGGLTAQWACAGVRWAVLQGFTRFLADAERPAPLSRLVALLCLLSPACESVRSFVAPPSERYDLSRLLLLPACSVAACVLWEMGFRKKKSSSSELQSRRLLVRMLKYFKVDAHYITAAFSFLILAVVCEYPSPPPVSPHLCKNVTTRLLPCPPVEALIPYYQGKVIDMLRGEELHSTFYSSIGQLALICLGR